MWNDIIITNIHISLVYEYCHRCLCFIVANQLSENAQDDIILVLFDAPCVIQKCIPWLNVTLYSRSWNSSVSIVISYKVDSPGFQIPGRKKYLSLLRNVQTDSRVLSYLHLVRRLRISEPILLLPICAITAWTRTTVYSTGDCNVCGCDTFVIGSAAASFSVLARWQMSYAKLCCVSSWQGSHFLVLSVLLLWKIKVCLFLACGQYLHKYRILFYFLLYF